MTKLDILIPTMDNQLQLASAVATMAATTRDDIDLKFIVVNNGKEPIAGPAEDAKIKLEVLSPGANIGWEGGLQLGLAVSDAPLVLFSNDDVHIPLSSSGCLNEMAKEFDDETVAAVGTSSNLVMGYQSIFGPPFDLAAFDVPFLIGFAVMVRRSALEQIGGVDASLPGGDDIDLSIRLRQAGFRLVCRKDLFIYHHGFQTGIRVHGDHTKPGGWNSPEMTKRTWDALRAKHGNDAIKELNQPLDEFWKLAADRHAEQKTSVGRPQVPA